MFGPRANGLQHKLAGTLKFMSDEEDDSVPQRRGADDDDESVLLPAFINKLIKMIADPECADILQYGADGNTILVVDSTQFAMVRTSNSFLNCRWQQILLEMSFLNCRTKGSAALS